MEIYKKGLLVWLLLIAGLTGCKKEEKKEGAPEKIIPPVVEAGNKKLIPVQLGTGKTKMVISYTEQMAFSKIEYGDGRKIEFTYDKQGKPFEVLRFRNDEAVSSTSYGLDENGQVIKAKMFTIKGDRFLFAGSYELRYNALNKPAGISYFNAEDNLLDKQERLYDEGGNLTSEKGGIKNSASVYSYDLKNGLFKQVNYAWLLTLEKENSLFHSGINNLLSYSNPSVPAIEQSFSYEYNANNYPEVINAVVNGLKTSAKVVYKEIR
ncbi:hypothetical protein H7F33_01245 [Pedobacter sp. PAMC26386]|nr:hypothetical protein H7F33_01245 [Pedobacter sp. PAMC26386]